MTVYLLCFTDHAGKHVLFSNHAGHYMGETDRPVGERRDEHQAGRGAKLTAAAAKAGITFVVARTWPGSRTEERRLKGRAKGSHQLTKKCPNCHPMPRIDRWAGGQPAPARPAEPQQAPARQPTTRPPAPARPRPGRYQRGATSAFHFLASQEGRTAGQIAATHAQITAPAREAQAAGRWTPAQAEEFRGYNDTVARGLAELRDMEQPPAAAARSAARGQGAQSRTPRPPEPGRRPVGTVRNDRGQAQEDATAGTGAQRRKLAATLERGKQSAQRLRDAVAAQEAADDARARSRAQAGGQQRQASHHTAMEIS